MKKKKNKLLYFLKWIEIDDKVVYIFLMNGGRGDGGWGTRGGGPVTSTPLPGLSLLFKSRNPSLKIHISSICRQFIKQ